ncbi:hypothetical protein O181_061199 [Austropuccinia psidii MF-1]|uniref:Uncharacterized protein n=1 Tax=Austropuccinia psidii MF-1 TaxID=1389203 RepID=A0A9Q3I0C4_9BASI|nr:hypothetical protein [Austropuccinia psidii MF-1]
MNIGEVRFSMGTGHVVKNWSMAHNVGPMDPLETRYIWAQGAFNSLHGPYTIGHQKAKNGLKPRKVKIGHGDGQHQEPPVWSQMAPTPLLGH